VLGIQASVDQTRERFGGKLNSIMIRTNYSCPELGQDLAVSGGVSR
jgi:hypothetical protein